MTREQKTGQKRVRLRPRDPFDLIRLLARSQSDARKAVAELVQNSLDAGARNIEITWFNERGRRCLRIWDDGEGVFPELEREQALFRIAKTIGHSHKLDLTPAQRREQMVLGKYGIGLIGFWSVGEVLEMKSRVGGGKAHVLRLREDRVQGEVFPSRSRRVGEEDTYTEVTVKLIHEAAVNKIRPPRLQAYLANELRGQLLERSAVVRIHDRVARGRACKEFTVEPRPYLGRLLEDLREVEVPGFESARLELYLVAPEEDRSGTVSLACGGTVVLPDVAEIDGGDALREPWSSGRIEGVIDFPDLHVSPTRRGLVYDEPVSAFLIALEGLEAELRSRLEQERRRQLEQARESLARDIRRAYRSVARRLPEYDFFGLRGARSSAGGSDASSAPADRTAGRAAQPDATSEGEPLGPVREPTSPESEVIETAEPSTDGQETLYPPGLLARLEVRPRALRLPPHASRTLRARTLDADGRPCAGPVDVSWHLFGEGRLESREREATFVALELAPEAAGRIRIVVRAVQEEIDLEVEIAVRLTEPPGAAASVEGIPEPQPVAAGGESWRSRIRDGRWEYNVSHRDYAAVADVETRRLRYLIHLLAKEIVLRNFGRPGDAEVLERVVEVLTWLDADRRR